MENHTSSTEADKNSGVRQDAEPEEGAKRRRLDHEPSLGYGATYLSPHNSANEKLARTQLHFVLRLPVYVLGVGRPLGKKTNSPR
jgi:hypothetical protein